jgi:hypothetical protein
MKKLEVQKFLGANGLAALEEKYAIVARRHNQYPNLVCLKYHMLDSPMGERISQECRGLILDEDNDWGVVCYPFDKFFNYGEGHAAKIDWATASVQEKVDGSLMSMYFYNGEWHVASSGLPDASGGVNNGLIEWRENGITYPYPKDFAELFWKIAEIRGYPSIHPQGTLHPDYCYMFEMVGPLNRVVVRHEKSNIILLGARDLITGNEVSAKEAHSWCNEVPAVRSYELGSLDDIIATFKKMSPVEQEGYVVVDSRFNRVKVKCPAYVALHHMKGNEVSHKELLKIAVAGENDEWVTYFDRYKEPLQKIRGWLEELISEVSEDYSRVSTQVGADGSQKDFALLATKTRIPSALFCQRSGKQKIADHIRGIHINKLYDMMKKDIAEK